MKRITTFMPPIFNWKYGCLGSVVWLLLIAAFGQLGIKFKDDISPEVFLTANIVFFGIIIYYLQDFKKKKAPELSELAAFTASYNERVKVFNEETGKLLKTHSKINGSTSYYQMLGLFNQETDETVTAFNAQHPKVLKALNTWKWLSIALVIYILAGCSFQIGLTINEDPSSSLLSEQEDRLWCADNITLPHLTNGDLYVSNPDSILSANTVDSMNAKMKILDRDLGIETAVVVVNHLKDDDPFRFSQDLFAKYGIGKDDRGLVIVMAYGDHSINMSTGSSLEADLTDAECKRLQMRYLIPYVKAEQPDSGMLLLADGLIAMMSKKEMPTDADTRIASLKSSNNNDLEKEDGYFMFYLVMLVFWYFVVRKQSKQMDTLAGLPGRYPASNPFYRYTTSYSSSSGSSSSSSSYSSSSSSSYSSSSSSSSSSSGSSGGYSGGHSSGGGATSRW